MEFGGRAVRRRDGPEGCGAACRWSLVRSGERDHDVKGIANGQVMVKDHVNQRNSENYQKI